MQLPIKGQNQKLSSPQLPLAVYREVATHLRQVEGVEANLIIRPIKHEPGAKFDYYQSQVAALEIHYPEAITAKNQQRVTEILDYYAQRYYPWENVSSMRLNI
jgi:hypothetical protein